MIRQSRPFRIGLFVLGGIGLVLAGLIAFGIQRQLARKLRFETYLPRSAGDLAVGSPVKLKGVPVGEVTDIGFSWIDYPGGRPECVVVRFTVRERLSPSRTPSAVDQAVRQGWRAVVENQGLTGAAFLSVDVLDPAANPPLQFTWTPRFQVIPSAESQLQRLLASVQAVGARLEKLDVERVVAHLDQLLRSTDETVRQFGQVDARGLSDSFGEAARSAQAAGLEAQALARDARGTLQAMRLETVAKDADRLVAGLRESNASVQRLVERLSAIDIRDLNETLAVTREASRRLNDSLEALNRYPSGFFLGKEPPPVQGIGGAGR